MSCDDLRLSLGAYAVGTLEPVDEDAVETHLASCPACLAELAELQSVVPSLASLSADDLTPPAPSPGLFDRIVQAVEPAATATPLARKRHPSTRWLLSAAAAVVVLAAGGTAAGIAVSHSSSRPATTFASGTAGDISLRVAASDLGHGTRLELTARGLRNHEHCHLVATADDGSTHAAGTWDASYEGKAKVVETTDVPRSDIRSLTLFGDGDRRLVVVNT